MTIYDQNDEPVECPECGEVEDVGRLPADESLYGIGLYQIYNFIGGLYQGKQYKCNSCGYEW